MTINAVKVYINLYLVHRNFQNNENKSLVKKLWNKKQIEKIL